MKYYIVNGCNLSKNDEHENCVRVFMTAIEHCLAVTKLERPAKIIASMLLVTVVYDSKKKVLC